MVKTWTYKELDKKYGKLCNRYKEVCYDKQRLKAQLDREIHINRKMKSALEKYADKTNWRLVDKFPKYNEVWIFTDCGPNEVGFEPAQQVLQEIDNKE